MPKCKVCGKKGFFLKLNSKGQCEECEKKIHDEEVQAAILKEQKRQQEIKAAKDAVIKEQEKQQKILAEEVCKTCHEDYDLLPDCVVTDIETTGLDISKDLIIELSAIKVINGKIVGAFSRIINQPIKITGKIASLTGISSIMMEREGVPEKDVMEEYNRFVGDLPLVGHNITEFDIFFINGAASCYLNKVFKNPCFDTLKMARRLLPMASSHKLEHLKYYTRISFGTSHRALGDCETTLNLFNLLRSISIADMIKWHDKGKPLLENDKFPKYISGFYPDGEASILQKNLINIGFLEKADPFLSLESLKVDQLKEILANNSLPVKGTKQELITRITENISRESLDIDAIYVPSKIGLEYEEKYHKIVKNLPEEI